MEGMVQDLNKEKAGSFMKLERRAFSEEEKDPDNKANGFYQRDQGTQFGEIKDLKVP